VKLASEILEPNQLREAVGATSVSQYGTGNGSYVLVEMEQVFTGWVTITGMKGKPGGQVTIMASAVPTPVNHDVCHQDDRPSIRAQIEEFGTHLSPGVVLLCVCAYLR